MTDMKYVMEDFFRMVTPRIMDAGRYSENGDIWLSISSPEDTTGYGSVIVNYDPKSQIIGNISYSEWDKEAHDEKVYIFTQSGDYDHLAKVCDLVDWNTIVELSRSYVNKGGLRG